MVRGAVLFNFHEALKVEALELKPPRADEVVVKVAASGVCHSDLSVQQMKLPVPPPAVLGHEGAGIVEEVGKDVTTLKKGDHVVLSWVENCGRCHYCINGTVHLCDKNQQGLMTGEENVFRKGDIDIARMAGVGSFADHTVVRATAAIKIPDDVPLDRACLVGCGVMTGVGAVINTAKVRPGQTVAVFGCGGVGLNVVQGAALSGASRIIAVDLSKSKLELAKAFGATDVVDASGGTDAADAVRELTGGLGVDYAFEVIGAPPVIVQAFLSVKRGGKVIVVGVPPFGSEVPIPGFSLPLEEKSVIGSLYGSANMRRDMPKLIDLYMRGRLKIDELVSRRIKLDDVNAAFDAIEKGEVARSVIVY
jgi:S-(hydroxymethyl)glutathione dehydrogenase / alcohol dehydrogenase